MSYTPFDLSAMNQVSFTNSMERKQVWPLDVQDIEALSWKASTSRMRKIMIKKYVLVFIFVCMAHLMHDKPASSNKEKTR